MEPSASASQPQVLFQCRPSLRRAYFYTLLLTVAISFGRIQTAASPSLDIVWWTAFGGVLLIFLGVHIVRLCSTFTITERDIESRVGVLSRQISSVPVDSVANVVARQNLSERIFGLINLDIDSPASTTVEVTFRRITKADAAEAKRLIEQLSYDERSQRNSRPE